MTTQQREDTPRSRSTTTFSAGSSLTIASNARATVIARHPRSVPVRRAEARSKALLSTLSSRAFTPRHAPRHHLATVLILLPANLLPLLPIALHALHRNALLTTLAHIPAAGVGLLLHYLLTVLPRRPFLAVTESHLVHRPSGWLSAITATPLSALRAFRHAGALIAADTVAPPVTLPAPDKHTASAAVQALNTALSTRDIPKPPESLLPAPGELVVTAATPLCEYRPPRQKIHVATIGDRLHVRTVGPPFPRVVLVFLGFLLSHAVATVLLMFVFDDLPPSITPITAAMISAIALAGAYGATVVAMLAWYLIRCMPRKWDLLVVGYRKDVKAGMIDVGKCRHVVLLRNKNGFGVRIVSTTGNRFLDVGGLTEGEAARLVTALRESFPSLFQGSV